MCVLHKEQVLFSEFIYTLTSALCHQYSLLLAKQKAKFASKYVLNVNKYFLTYSCLQPLHYRTRLLTIHKLEYTQLYNVAYSVNWYLDLTNGYFFLLTSIIPKFLSSLVDLTVFVLKCICLLHTSVTLTLSLVTKSFVAPYGFIPPQPISTPRYEMMMKSCWPGLYPRSAFSFKSKQVIFLLTNIRNAQVSTGKCDEMVNSIRYV